MVTGQGNSFLPAGETVRSFLSITSRLSHFLIPPSLHRILFPWDRAKAVKRLYIALSLHCFFLLFYSSTSCFPFLYLSIYLSICPFPSLPYSMSIHSSSSIFSPISVSSLPSFSHSLNTHFPSLFSISVYLSCLLLLPSCLPILPCPPIVHPFCLSLFLITLWFSYPIPFSLVSF